MLENDYGPGEPAPGDAPRSWRDVLDDLRSRWTFGQLAAGALLCAGVLVAALAVLRPATPRAPTELSLPSAASASSSVHASTASTGTTAPSVLVVHVAGAVVAPGLYRVRPGSRVADAIAAAGGLGESADVDRINLAALVRDGERVAVPRVGEPAVLAVDGGAGGAGGDAASGPIDLNTATVEQLDALPGLGRTTARAIVDDRERNGPFRSVDDLLRVRGIGPAKLDQLRGMVTV